MPAKRAGDEVQGGARKRVASGPTSRTGQACNRCKLRKIKCDARPGGCSPCLQNNTECTTTDRITGRAVSRGHTETIEGENAALKQYTEQLLQQLREHGVDPKPPPVIQHDYIQTPWGEDWQQQGSWGDLGSETAALASSTTSRNVRSSQPSVLPDFRPGCVGDNYLGVSMDNNGLSPITGTRLSLFGIPLDLAEYIPKESENEYDPSSYQAFLDTALGKKPPAQRPDLPPLATCQLYADWYFSMVQVFTPILHRADFMKLLPRVHSRQCQSTGPELVMVHMVLAILMLQTSLRNPLQAQMKTEAMAHYHYALSFVPDLLIGHQLAHVQALALICLYLRQQPRVGAAWSFSKTVITLAIELGLHRSATSWPSKTSERDPHIIEMRKRVFWSLLVINVTVGGKLGRPMPLRIQDFDIEMPDPTDDMLPGETSVNEWQKCSFRAALPGMKLLKILMQVYATVYSIRPDATPYEHSVRRLESELAIFRKELPPEIDGGAQTADNDKCPAYYLQMAEQEIRLLLHHPSLRAGSLDPSTESLNICLDASKKLLSTASNLQAMKSLDTTWYYSIDYLAAIFTTLFVWTQRQAQMSAGEFQQLKDDMDKWLDVMGDVGALLGTGGKLRERLRHIIEPRIAIISHFLAAKTGVPAESPISASNGLRPLQPSQHPQHQPAPVQQLYTPTNGFPSHYHDRSQSHDLSNSAPPGYPVPVQHQTQQHQQQPPPSAYPPPPPGYYSEPSSATIPQYPGMGSFDAAYQNQDVKHALSALAPQAMPPAQPQQHQQTHQQSPIHPHPHQQPTPQHAQPSPYLTNAFSPVQQQPQHNGFHTHTLPPQHQPQPPPMSDQHQQMLYPNQAAWRGFADDMMSDMSVGGADFMSPANALMSLGGTGVGVGVGVGEEQGGWPMVQQFGGGVGGGQQ